MNLTGYSSRPLLDLKTNNFLFKELSIYEPDYSHKIIFSGQGKTFQFLFSGHKILDNSNKFFWSYNSGEYLDFLVKFNDTKYSYYINSDLISDGYKDSFKLEKLIVDTSGDGIYFKPSFSSDNVDVDIRFTTNNFASGEDVSFELENLSAAKINVRSVDFKDWNNGLSGLSFQKNQTGILSGFQTLNFTSKDLTENNENYENFKFVTYLTTSAGMFSRTGLVNRLNPLQFGQTNYSHPGDTYINHLFSGETGVNSFTFSRSSITSDLLLGIERLGKNTSRVDATGFLGFELTGVSGFNTGVFIKGINISNYGFYSLPPNVVISSFSGVESISVNEKNLISYDAGDSFNLVFSGNGTGLTGRALTKKYTIQLFTGDNPSYKFRSITGVEIDSKGYGFNANKYSVSLPDSIVDYAKTYVDPLASELGYASVKFTSNFFTTAGFASGRPVFHENDNTRILGVLLMGPGSGYNTPFQVPAVSFIRSPEDSYVNTGSNVASGSCVLNSSGEQIGFNNWNVLGSRSLSTNISDYDLPLQSVSGKYYFGPIIFNEQNKELWLKIQSTNSTLYEDNGLKFTFYETGNFKEFFSVFSRNEYFIPETVEGATDGMFMDIFDSE